MDNKQYQAIRSWFVNYAKSFYESGAETRAAVRFKKEHTGRVCSNIVRIGRSIDLQDGDLLIAETIALLHDVGRFKQYAVYRTFKDHQSENHALLGLRELERAGILSVLTPDEQVIVTHAIEYHNLRDLPVGMPERLLLFTRLIRDADKLDILKLVSADCAHRGKAPDPLAGFDLPNTPGYSAVLAQNLLRYQPCNYAAVTNVNDRKLLHLSWVYDINFPYTLSEIARNGYIETIVRSLPDTEEIRSVYDHLKSYLARRLVQPGVNCQNARS
ncbi:MAG: HD domain-containing protein [Bacillota bacterium]